MGGEQTIMSEAKDFELTPSLIALCSSQRHLSIEPIDGCNRTSSHDAVMHWNKNARTDHSEVNNVLEEEFHCKKRRDHLIP